MSQSRITGAVLLCWEDCTSILSKHLTTLLQRPIQLCRMVEDYDSWCVASINGRFSIPELHSLIVIDVDISVPACCITNGGVPDV